MIISAIPNNAQSQLVRIEQSSNPHAWTISALITAFAQYQGLGVFRAEKLIAFLLYQTVADEAEVIHFVCDKKEQGRGNASALLRYFIHQCQQSGIQQLHLEVRASNIRAIRLYQHVGFVEVGRRNAYYRDKEDAILMQLHLP